MRRDKAGLGALLLFGALTVLMTWPQAARLSTHLPDADDPLLSIWRLAWIAHILPVSPADLMNGNIFYPEPRTLAYTDSVLMQGLVAAPLLWSGLSPVSTYNLILLASIALSGWTMFLYARHLTSSVSAGVLAGIVFAFVPFRFDHLHHLELQATMFMPLALLWVDRALATGARRDVWLAVAAVAAQVYCGIYYAIFLATALLVVVPWRWRDVPAERRAGVLRASVAASVTGAVVVLPYLAVYMLNRGSLGERDPRDIQAYSATLQNYLATPTANVLHGGWSGRLGENERRLFPGAMALAVAAIGVIGLERRRATLLAVGALGFVISLGVNTPFYSWLTSVLFIYSGLRAPARASILFFLALAGLVAFGWSRLESRLQRWAPAATAVVAAALLAEYATVHARWYVPGPRPPAVYEWLDGQPRSVVLELPLSTADRLDILPDGVYMFRSTEHWQPIVNGYSGFFPKSYIELTERMKTFPDDPSIAYLKTRQVDLVVIHGGMMAPDALGALTGYLMTRSDFELTTQFAEPNGPDVVFRVLR
ncbi:MAG: hypothetical protein Q8O42_09105 [Acidobacteriota bacterium]|nr:hypothetical protein [Acidobacteriota bacterium]